jgi:2-polyprenyl-3-methyl-5-hydroxy-6-metoxy-1,4-benzoquinol methylase
MVNDQLNAEDIRQELYKKYLTGFKKFISRYDIKSIESDRKVFKRRYLPLIKNFPPDAGIIEFGCGPGYFLQFLNDNGFSNTFGIDISGQQVEQAKSKNVNANVADVFEFIRTNKKKFDIIFALDFIEHFNKDELLKLFNGFYDTLSKNGIIIMHTPNGEGLFPNQRIYGDLTHYTIFTPNSLQQILRITNFSDIEFFEAGPVSKNVVGFIRVVLWKVIKLAVYIVRIIETGSKENILTQDFICVARKK